MARNGSGTYSLPAGNPVVTGTTISSTTHNSTLTDIATALTGSVAVDGQAAMTGNLQMGSNKITGLAAGTVSTDAVRYSQLPGAVSQINGLRGTQNTGTPLTKYDLAADSIQLTDTSGFAVIQTNVAAITCDLGLAGTIINGRDQAGAFTASSWVHLYFIWNGATLATLASASAPPTAPTLPGGYTHWAYAGAIRWNGSSNIVPGYIRGSTFLFDVGQGALSGGTATTETAITITSYVPPNAATFLGYAEALVTAGGGGAGTNSVALRVITTKNIASVAAYAATSQTAANSLWIEASNKNNTLYYLNTTTGTPSVAQLTFNILGYRMPNGAT